MKTTIRKSVQVFLSVLLILVLSGCSEENSKDSGKPLRLQPIYNSAIEGAIIGGLIGHQSDEPGEGAAIGATLFGITQLISEIDRQHKKCEHENEDECKKTVVEIHNSNDSVSPVKLKKEGDVYSGPKGERYEKLPTEEQLKPIYGL